MAAQRKYPEELRERAVKMVSEIRERDGKGHGHLRADRMRSQDPVTCLWQRGGMLDHLSIQCADVRASAASYDAVLGALGGTRVMDFGEVIGFGAAGKPEFRMGGQTSGEGFRESHIAIAAPDRAAVLAFGTCGVPEVRLACELRRWPGSSRRAS